jgi:23S rRNA (uracil1939-C5)-methyltransferase
LLEFGPKRVVYVSCGPDTQARDLGHLLNGPYRVVDVQPVDLFPQTRHIENIVTLERTEAVSAAGSN